MNSGMRQKCSENMTDLMFKVYKDIYIFKDDSMILFFHAVKINLLLF